MHISYLFCIFARENMKMIKWGFIGCGEVTETKSGPAFSEVEGSSVVAVTDEGLAAMRSVMACTAGTLMPRN